MAYRVAVEGEEYGVLFRRERTGHNRDRSGAKRLVSSAHSSVLFLHFLALGVQASEAGQ